MYPLDTADTQCVRNSCVCVCERNRVAGEGDGPMAVAAENWTFPKGVLFLFQLSSANETAALAKVLV